MARIIPFGGKRPRIATSAFVAPTAVVIGDVEVGEHASIWFGAVLRGDHPEHGIHVGARTNVQDNAVIHTSDQGPTVLEDKVTVGHGAILESCRIGMRTVVGMGASVLQRADVGEACVIAAGAVVKEGARIPPQSLVAGVPGRVRALGATAAAWTERSSGHYVALSRRYLADAACELCGGRTMERHCKILCLNCGYQRDCSDP
ncbi:MAG: gamma carbonic anhydrase family protein [Gemmatimonadota bacterium]|nr:gamma carbonic anhydrase family protein [Gemmatimonadota bacterium]